MEREQLEELGERVLRVSEAAKRKNVSRKAVYAAIAQKRLRHINVGGRIFIWDSDLAAWEPVRYGSREGAKGKGGRPAGTPMSDEAKSRISEAQKKRWERINKHKTQNE